MKQVLFVCTGNTCRSPMAQALFEKLAAEKEICAQAASAGIAAAASQPASEHAIAAVREYGGDLTRHRSRQADEKLLREADLVIAMTPQQLSVVQPFCKKAVLLDKNGISDPFGGSLAQYRACCDQICAALEEMFDKGLFDEY